MDLDTFFSQWVTDGFGYPFYRSTSFWEASQGGGYEVSTFVEQYQSLPGSNMDVFVMPLDIAVQTTAGEQRFRVQNSQRLQLFQLHVAAEPLGVVIDPEAWILRDEEIPTSVEGGPSRSIVTTITPNPARGRLTVGFALARAGEIAVDVFDVAGRRIVSRSIAAPRRSPGRDAGRQPARRRRVLPSTPFEPGQYGCGSSLSSTRTAH